MTAVLGVSALYHDAAAALVIDGAVIAAVQEERLSRIKNDPSLPERAIRACLDHAGLGPGDLDAVVFYEDPYAKLERVLRGVLGAYPRSWRQFPRALGSQLGGKLWVLDRLAELAGVDRRKVEHVDHHRAHAASAFLVSPFARAAVLVVDAVGERASTSLWRGEGSALVPLEEIAYPDSLGLFYAAMTAYLGFEVNEGEYKLMGLAGFGRAEGAAELERVIERPADGAFRLALPYFAHLSDAELGFGPRLEALLGPRRPPGRPWDLASEADRRYADVAAMTQRLTEEILLGLARRARAVTGCDALCLAGGVALNALANGRLLREGGFARVFVQPAAGDAGGALGAALLGAIARGAPRPAPLRSAALGPAIDPGQARAVAEALGFRTRTVGDPAAAVAERLAAGQVVALATGRVEWGPRALGQRSLLAAPKDAATRDRINHVVKQREPFRPFAPAVLASRAAEWFDAPDGDLTRFMTTVCPVRPEARARLAAVTHADGSARVQTVEADGAPRLHEILTALGALGELPIALNTSLNGRGEPICAGATDVVSFFARHPVDAAVVDDVVIERRPA